MVGIAELYEVLKHSSKVPKGELRLLRGVLIIHKYDVEDVPLRNIAEEVGCCLTTVRNVLSHREDYGDDGERWHAVHDKSFKVSKLTYHI